MGSMDTSTINQEFTVIGDFINYYKWLFDVSNFLLLFCNMFFLIKVIQKCLYNVLKVFMQKHMTYFFIILESMVCKNMF